jgi:diguanylate cyclase (GGDEF)-like protein
LGRLEQEIRRTQRAGTLFAVVYLDLDNFKRINDTFGHDGGDSLLRQIAERLAGCVRAQDTFSRFGGDEFLFLLTDISHAEDMRMSLNKILNALSQPVVVEGEEIIITASAGAAVFPIDGDSAELLVKRADLAMYTAKRLGKNRYALYSP